MSKPPVGMQTPPVAFRTPSGVGSPLVTMSPARTPRHHVPGHHHHTVHHQHHHHQTTQQDGFAVASPVRIPTPQQKSHPSVTVVGSPPRGQVAFVPGQQQQPVPQVQQVQQQQQQQVVFMPAPVQMLVPAQIQLQQQQLQQQQQQQQQQQERIPDVSDALPDKPPALNLFIPPTLNGNIEPTPTHKAIIENYNLQVPAKQLMHPANKPCTVNLAQVLLNLGAVKEHCTVPWLKEDIGSLQDILSKLIALVNSTVHDDVAFASIADNFVGELLRVHNFTTADDKALRVLSDISKRTREQLFELLKKREAMDDPHSETAIEALASEVPKYSELETIAYRTSSLEMSRQMQASEMIRNLVSELKNTGEINISSLCENLQRLHELCQHDLTQLSAAQEQELKDFNEGNRTLETNFEDSNRNLASIKADQVRTAEDIANLQRRLQRLKDEEEDCIKTLVGIQDKKRVNDEQHRQWIENCTTWRSFLETTSNTSKLRVDASNLLLTFIGKTTSLITRRYSDLVTELRAVQMHSLTQHYEAARHSYLTLGQLLNIRFNQLSSVRSDIVDVEIAAETQNFKHSPRTSVWLAEKQRLTAEEDRLKILVEQHKAEFLECKRRFESLEKFLHTYNIRYDHPREELEQRIVQQNRVFNNRKRELIARRSMMRGSAPLSNDKEDPDTTLQPEIEAIFNFSSNPGHSRPATATGSSGNLHTHGSAVGSPRITTATTATTGAAGAGAGTPQHHQQTLVSHHHLSGTNVQLQYTTVDSTSETSDQGKHGNHFVGHNFPVNSSPE